MIFYCLRRSSCISVELISGKGDKEEGRKRIVEKQALMTVIEPEGMAWGCDSRENQAG